MDTCEPTVNVDGNAIGNPMCKTSLASQFISSSWPKWILVMLAIKVILFGIGIIVAEFFHLHFVPDDMRWLDVWYRWDVKEYLTVTLNGYEPGTPDAYLAVRPPIVPLLIRGIAFLGVHNLLVAGFIMATLVSIPVPVLMQKLAALDYPPPQAERITWLLLIFPMSFCLHLPLSEGIFMVLALSAFLAARSNDWLQAGLAAALAGATRVNGILLFPALFVEAAHQYHLQRKINFQWAWVALAPIGTFSYLLMNRLIFGNSFAFMKSTSGLSWPWVSLAGLFHSIFTKPSMDKILWVYPQCFTIGLLFIVAIWACFKCRPSYSIWAVLNIALMTSQHFILSIPRYAIAVFPMYFFLAEITGRRLAYLMVTAVFIFLFLYFSALFANGWWAF